MTEYKTYQLANGLNLLVNEDRSTPLAVVNILYKVGSRNENSMRTGFAHLFEHLMFGGTPNIPDYDHVVNEIGGESNAATNTDYTFYHVTAPANYLETVFWLESDRMRGLLFSEKSLDVQKKVVTEEYRQRYENQPEGDLWMLLRSLCYKVHPYQWCTIGKTIDHVKSATIDEVKLFFQTYYNPSNAIMAVAGNVDSEHVYSLVQKWFADIEGKPVPVQELPQEPEPTEAIRQIVYRDVPSSTVYVAHTVCARAHKDFPACDLLTDILCNGNSSRLYVRLVMNEQLCTEVNSYVTGELDPGLLIISAKLADGVSPEAVERIIDEELQRLIGEEVPEYELGRVKNKFEATFEYSKYKPIDRALQLCQYYMLGSVELINSDPEVYHCVSAGDLRAAAARYLSPHRRRTLFYLKNDNSK